MTHPVAEHAPPDPLPRGAGGRSARGLGLALIAVAALVAIAAVFMSAGSARSDGEPVGSDSRVAHSSTTIADGRRPTPTSTTHPTSDATSSTVPLQVGTHSASLDELHTRAAPTPTQIRIDDLSVDAAVSPAGIATDGSGKLAVPSNAKAVVWYQFGPSPGSDGSAVLAGHVDYDGVQGVFFHLVDLTPGAQLTVTYDDGTDRRFRVTDQHQVAKAALPTDAIFDRTGPPRLTLITCGGSFDPAARSYRDNIVVTAVPSAP